MNSAGNLEGENITLSAAWLDESGAGLFVVQDGGLVYTN
jgi:hypothetical protein